MASILKASTRKLLGIAKKNRKYAESHSLAVRSSMFRDPEHVKQLRKRAADRIKAGRKSQGGTAFRKSWLKG